MKTVTLSEYKDLIYEITEDVTVGGEVYRVDAGNIGTFVIMGEVEYSILHDALKMVLTEDR